MFSGNPSAASVGGATGFPQGAEIVQILISRLAPLAIVAAFAMGCGGSSPPSAPAEARLARLDISYFPDPAVGSPAPNRAPGFVTRVELRIRDLGGVGVELARIEAGVSIDPGSLVVLEAPEIVARAGSSRVESRGLLVVAVEIAYESEDGLADVQVVMSGTDDRGNAISYDGGLPVRYTGR